VWIATAAVAVVLFGIVSYLVYQSEVPKPPPPARQTAGDRAAPPGLIRAANAVGFVPTTEFGVGQVEGQPASASPKPSSTKLLKVGTNAPVFSLRTPQGQRVTAPARGRPTLLEFFATWCPHCNAEAPHLRALARRFGSKVDFVSVNADSENPASVFAFHRYFGLPYPALVDQSGTPTGSYHRPGGLGHWASVYGVGAYPTFYVIGADGRVQWADDSEQPDILLQQLLQRAVTRA
jgi:thiol-disulfide isomerase/thioredoxin